MGALYGGSHLETGLPDGSGLALAQKTGYPWEAEIAISIEQAPAEPFALMLRMLAWMKRAAISVNGRSTGIEAHPGTYATLDRAWSAGDVIELTLPMDARLVIAHPKVEQVRNQAAVARGPVVYCLESVDLRSGVDLDEVYLPRNIGWTPRYDAGLLGGITVLEGRAPWFSSERGLDGLYRPLGDVRPTPLPISLIPYFAWANRGIAKMSVWLPLCR